MNRDQIINLRPLLIDLTSQGEKQDLSSSLYHLRCVDRYGIISLREMGISTLMIEAWGFSLEITLWLYIVIGLIQQFTNNLIFT